MTLHLQIIGILLILLASVHIVFPKYFRWKEELGSLSTINREMMYVHTFFIALVVLMIAIICLTSNSELIETPFGRRMSLGLSIFWGMRLLIQFFGYSPKIWRGKRFETMVHILFIFFWAYMSTIFFIIYLH